MSSPFSTDAPSPFFVAGKPLLVDKENRPLIGQVPLKTHTITATGAVPDLCGDVVCISGAAAITVSCTTAAQMGNMMNREVTFCSDNVNAVAHIVQFPANSISGAQSRVTFAANSGASATFIVRSLTHVVIKSLSNATAS